MLVSLIPEIPAYRCRCADGASGFQDAEDLRPPVRDEPERNAPGVRLIGFALDCRDGFVKLRVRRHVNLLCSFPRLDAPFEILRMVTALHEAKLHPEVTR
jgi:hypothetical protein